jgi:hypothetical protein
VAVAETAVPAPRRRRRLLAGALAGATAWLALGTLCPSRAEAIEVVWDSSSTPYPGLRVRRGHSVSPTIYFRAAFASLCNDYVHVRATSPPSTRRTASSWGTSVGVQLAVNGDFFEYSSPPQVQGDAVGGGTHWPSSQTGVNAQGEWYYRRYGWIAFGPGWVEFSHTRWTKQHAAAYEADGYTVRSGWQPTTPTTEIPPGTRALVSGFPELVIEGRVKTCPDPAGSACFPDRTDMQSGHRRTAMGLTMDRRTFILVTTESTSVLGRHLAAIMAELGAWEAFNLDGGGSTQMWLESSGYLVSSSDSPDRPVANHWGVFAGAGSGMPLAPSSCDPCVDQLEVCDGVDNDCNGEIDEGTCDRAALADATSLEDWPACSARDVTIAMDNVGGTTWDGAAGVGLRFESGPLDAPALLPVEGTVAPGERATFQLTAVADEAEGAGVGRWTMVRGETAFDEPAELPVAITPPPFRSALVDWSYPNALREGERTRVWAAFRNQGTEPWSAAEIVLGTVPPERASALWAESWLAFDVPARIEQAVAPGGFGGVEFEVAMTEAAAGVPETFGLRAPDGAPFGCAEAALELDLALERSERVTAPSAATPSSSSDEDPGCSCRLGAPARRSGLIGLVLLPLMLRRRRACRLAPSAADERTVS